MLYEIIIKKLECYENRYTTEISNQTVIHQSINISPTFLVQYFHFGEWTKQPIIDYIYALDILLKIIRCNQLFIYIFTVKYG